MLFSCFYYVFVSVGLMVVSDGKSLLSLAALDAIRCKGLFDTLAYGVSHHVTLYNKSVITTLFMPYAASSEHIMMFSNFTHLCIQQVNS